MTSLREDLIHYAVRRMLRQCGWQLVAGQYPNGSDDELPPLHIVDPTLARDNSPDHRRHSKNKYVPDLVVCRQNMMILIEMKPHFSQSDEQKLDIILTKRHIDLITALEKLVGVRGVTLPVPVQLFTFVPCLAFGATSRYKSRPDFCYLLVSDIDTVNFRGNVILPSL